MAETILAPPSRRPASTLRAETRPITRALVIDPDRDTLSFAAEALSSFTPGLEVATAGDVQQAAAWLESFQPQIILVSDALAAETLRHLGAAGAGAFSMCTLVLMSGGDGASISGDAASTNSDGAFVPLESSPTDRPLFDRVLSKPLQLQPLLGAVRSIMGSRESH